MPTGDETEISYNDLERLLAEFKESMDVLKQKMREDGDKETPGGDDEQPAAVNEEDQLIAELNELRKFVYDNKECIEDFFGIQRDDENNKQHDNDHDNNGDDKDPLNDSRDKDFDH